MKTFSRFVVEQTADVKTTSPYVFSFVRMNPPTNGHELLVNKVHELSHQYEAPHEIVMSRSQDPKKNPLSVDKKVEHARKAFPGTNFTGATAEHPTLMHHAARINAAGHDHLVMVAGSDRVDEYRKLLNAYNGKPDKTGKVGYNFKKIDVVSSGNRDPDSEDASGMSGTKMRAHAQNNNFGEFRKGLPSKVSDDHAKQIFKDVRSGMQLKESVWRRFKDWLSEDFGGMTSSEGGVRGLGNVTGEPATGVTNNYIAGNVADFSSVDDELFKIKKNHDMLHNMLIDKKKKITRK